MNSKKIDKLIFLLKSKNWNICLGAALKLGKLNSEESVEPLLTFLESSDNNQRNLAALGLSETNDNKYLEVILNIIFKLGDDDDKGTLVYALQSFDCSSYLFEIIKIYLKSDFESQQMAKFILNEQQFYVKNNDLKKIDKILSEYNFTIDTFNLKYRIVD